MALNWINVADYSFNSFLLMERFQLRLLCGQAARKQELGGQLGIALRHNPAVRWYVRHKCPECAGISEALAQAAPGEISPQDVRRAEIRVMGAVEDFIVYCYPEIMDACCRFIYDWDRQRLFELADFAGKVVLDVGSGSGRLAFAAAQKAGHVYASEPVDTLREYLRDKIRREGIANVTVVDGMADSLPYPDGIFDIVMSGHVVGDDYERELAELTRVVKSGGWILDCPGDDACKGAPSQEMRRRGFEEFYHETGSGGCVYRYRRQIFK